MRDSTVIMEEIKQLETVIASGLEIQKVYKDDFVLNLTLEEDANRYSSLINELQEAYLDEGRHSIKFIIKNVEKFKSLSVNRFFDSVKSLQDVIEQISKVVFHQDKSMMELAFSTTFPSSFGVLLALKSIDAELISKSYLSLEKAFDIFNDLNDDLKVSKVINTDLQNKRLLGKFKKFYKIQSDYMNEIELIWGDTAKSYHTAYIKRERMDYISNALGRYESIPDEERNISCIVKGISLVKKKVELQFNHKIFNAIADEDLIFRASKLLNQETKASILISRKLNEITDDIDEKWVIKDLATASTSI